MCRIMVTTDIDRRSTGMEKGGISSYSKITEGLKLFHEWLPIQTKLSEYETPIINNTLYNGEIFDYPEEYKNDLEFVSRNPQGLYIYDGFFSVIKVRKDGVYVATDLLGKKQLYWSKGYGIASEIRSLEGEVVKLKPGTEYTFSKDLMLIVEKKDHTHSIGRPSRDKLREALKRSIRDRVSMTNEKVALLLSGGIDSSLLFMMLKEQGIEVSTYCVDNGEDLKYARLVDSNVVEISLEDVDYAEAMRVMETGADLGSVSAQYQLFKSIEETVIITGDGADELFGGYKRQLESDYQDYDMFDELPEYHLVRLDRMASNFTKEVRSPYLARDVVSIGLSLPYEDRINKSYLRELAKEYLPKEVYERKKEPLKVDNRVPNSNMVIAEVFSKRSKCKRAQVGAIVVKDGRPVSVGYNGTPPGLSNCCEDSSNNTLDLVLHAEQNLISFSAKEGIPLDGLDMYVTLAPCKKCASLIASSGIRKVFYKKLYRDMSGIKLLRELGIETLRVN